ncbi:MAG: hypothetical protein ACREVV_04745 [Steroidobacteraceae bacterium]
MSLHIVAAGLLIGCLAACMSVKPVAPSPPPEQPAAVTPPNSSAGNAPAPVPAPARESSQAEPKKRAAATGSPPSATAKTQPSAANAKSPSTNSTARAVPPNGRSAASTSPSSANSPAKPSPPEQTAPASPPAAVATAPAAPRGPPPLDLGSLEQRLRDTHAIGVFTKLSLKNQVDDLLDQFRAFHQGRLKAPLAQLRQRYDLLLLKVLTLLQDGDPSLASAVSASRETIWGILADPDKFSKI